MIVWCKSCGGSMTYRHGGAFLYPWFSSAVDRPTCLPCSVNEGAGGSSPEGEQADE